MTLGAGPERCDDWELLLYPGVCWFVWDEDGEPAFSIAHDTRKYNGDTGRRFDAAFPPDIAYLLSEIVRDASELRAGAGKPILLAIPGDIRSWPGQIIRVLPSRFVIIWSEDGVMNGNGNDDRCDINEHIRSERAVRKANEKLNYFNAIVRHDIMNLVMGINGYIDIIEEIIDDEEAKLLLRKSRSLGDRVRRVAELTRSYQDLGTRPPSFIEVAESVNKILSRHEFTGKVEADVKLGGLLLFVDRMFDVVIYEIVRNSLQFGGTGVKMRFFIQPDPDGLLLVIEDTGPGVKPDEKEEIFARNYADRKGYGLYLASEILDITGVKIRETGTFGEGARFELIFPHDSYRCRDSSA